MEEIVVARSNHLVDPALAIWGWQIPVYLFLGGLAAGVMVLAGLLARRVPDRSRAARLLPFLAPIALSLGMLALFLDLENKRHVYRFYLAFRPASPMSWGSWILVLVYPVTLLAGLAGLVESEALAIAARLGRLGNAFLRARDYAVVRARPLETGLVVLGAGLGVYTGILLGTLGARAAWCSPVLGPLFLSSGLSAGAALLLLLPLGAEEAKLVARWDRWAMLGELVLLVLFLVGLGSGDAAQAEAARLLVAGRFAGPFFALVIAGGLVVPLMLGVADERSASRGHARLGPVLALGGGLALRWVLVLAGQA